MNLTSCATVFMPGRIWIGETCPTPELLAQALSHREDDNPAFFYRAMPNDLPEPEQTETLAPPTDREAPTSPGHDAPEPRQAMAPPAPTMPSAPPSLEATYFVEAAKHFGAAALEMRLGREQAARQHGESMGKLEDLGRRSDTNHDLVINALEKHGRRIDLLEDGHSEIRKQLTSVKGELHSALARVEELEIKLGLEGPNARPPTPAAPQAVKPA